MIELKDLPLSDLLRWMRGKLVIGKDIVPVGSIPVFGLDKAVASVQANNLGGNITLGSSATWASLPSPGPVTLSVTVSGLSDLWIIGHGTLIQSGSLSVHSLSVTIDGTDYQQFVHGAPASNAGLYRHEGTTFTSWSFTGKVPVDKLLRSTYDLELVYRRLSGTNTGLLGADAVHVINLYAVEY